MKFLDDAEDEDLIFTACSPVGVNHNRRNSNQRKSTALSSASAHIPSSTLSSLPKSSTDSDGGSFGRSPLHRGGGLGCKSDHISKSIGSPISPSVIDDDGEDNDNKNQRVIPFDRRTSAISKVKRSKSDPIKKKRNSSSSKTGRLSSKTSGQQSADDDYDDDNNRPGDHNDSTGDISTDEDDLQSFALEGGDGGFDSDDVTLSSDDDDDDDDDDEGAVPKRRLSRKNSSSSLGKYKQQQHGHSGRDAPTRRGISRNNSSLSAGRLRNTPRHSVGPPRTTTENNDTSFRRRSSSRGRLSRSVSARVGSTSTSASMTERKGPARTMSLTTSLGNLDRQVRRDRMKSGYRGPSRDARSVGTYRGNDGDDGDDSDDGNSIASGMSAFSTRSSMTTRKTGLEGGGLNAVLSDPQALRIGRRASLDRSMMGSGASVMSAPPDDDFIQQRKERQDRILDVALKEKYANEAREREEETSQQISRQGDGQGEDGDSDSDGSLKVGTKKKNGLLAKMQRAAKKTAKVSKSGAKGTVNVVKDPKRAAKKVGGFAKSVGKETGKMVLDPTLAAKMGAKNIKATAKLTTKMTKSLGKETLKLANTGLDVTSLVVGSTIDGTALLVNGATGLIIKRRDDDTGIEYADYDPKTIQGRQKDSSLISRFASTDNSRSHGDETAQDKSLRRLSRNSLNTPTVLAPSIKAGNSGAGGWDV